MLSQQDQEMRRNVPDPSFAGGSHFCGSGAGNETRFNWDSIPIESGLSDPSSKVDYIYLDSAARLRNLVVKRPAERGGVAPATIRRRKTFLTTSSTTRRLML